MNRRFFLRSVGTAAAGGLSLSCLQWRLEQLGYRCNFERE